MTPNTSNEGGARVQQLEAQVTQLRDAYKRTRTNPDINAIIKIVAEALAEACGDSHDINTAETHKGRGYGEYHATWIHGKIKTIATVAIQAAAEPLRAQGRHQADDAITWHTTCIGCAGKLNNLIKERAAGFTEGLEHAARAVETDTGFDAKYEQAYAARTIRQHLPHGKPIPSDDDNPF